MLYYFVLLPEDHFTWYFFNVVQRKVGLIKRCSPTWGQNDPFKCAVSPLACCLRKIPKLIPQKRHSVIPAGHHSPSHWVGVSVLLSYVAICVLLVLWNGWVKLLFLHFLYVQVGFFGRGGCQGDTLFWLYLGCCLCIKCEPTVLPHILLHEHQLGSHDHKQFLNSQHNPMLALCWRSYDLSEEAHSSATKIASLLCASGLPLQMAGDPGHTPVAHPDHTGAGKWNR